MGSSPLILEELEMGGQEIIYTAAMTTVMLSIVLHGRTAGPGAHWYSGTLTGDLEKQEMARDE